MNRPTGLPPGAVAYRQTPVFDQDTIPAGLQREHRTAAGVWGVITVLAGQLRLRLLDPPSQMLLSPGNPGVVMPEQPHEVAPEGATRFFVAFYRAGDTAEP